MSEAPTQVAPGVHRLGNALVNCYLIEDGNRMTLVDGGLPGFRPQLVEYLRSRGSSLADIDAVILTHAHSDHTGMAELVRTDAPATVHVHEADEQMARTGKTHARDGRDAALPAPPGRLPALLHRRPPRRRAHAEHRGADDVHRRRPRRAGTAARSIPTPGHSPGHVAFHLPDRGVLIGGDALCTYNPLTGKRGPQLMPRAFAFDIGQAQESLDALERIDAGLLLLGHGEPWTDGPAEAVARAREFGVT